MDIDGKPGFNRLWHLYNEAMKSGLFLYNKSKREWYTPEEFRLKYDNDRLSHSQITGILEDLVIRDPIAGIKAARKQFEDRISTFKAQMEADQSKVDEFAIHAIQYYQSKAASKTKKL